MERVTLGNKINEATETYSQIRKFVEKELAIKIKSIKQIKNGRNSQVFLIEQDEKKWIIKKYYRHSGDPRNRLETETSFLNYLNKIGLTSVTKPLAVENETNLGLFSYLPGKVPEIINKEIMDQVNDFINVKRGYSFYIKMKQETFVRKIICVNIFIRLVFYCG